MFIRPSLPDKKSPSFMDNFLKCFQMFIRGFAFYLSSMTLVCLSLDRFLAISRYNNQVA